MPERIQKPVEPAPWGSKQGESGGRCLPDIYDWTESLSKKCARSIRPNPSAIASAARSSNWTVHSAGFDRTFWCSGRPSLAADVKGCLVRLPFAVRKTSHEQSMCSRPATPILRVPIFPRFRCGDRRATAGILWSRWCGVGFGDSIGIR